MGLFSRFRSKKDQESLEGGIEKTRENFFGKLARVVAGKSKVDASVLDELEEMLISSDVGVQTTVSIIKRIEERVARDKFMSTDELQGILREEALNQMSEKTKSVDTYGFELDGIKKPFVMLVVGVNGVGKTTSIGKLAYRFKQAGHKVVLGAADTFRAAAVDQLEIWSERAGVDFVSKGMQADPSAVAYETLQKAINDNADVVLIDTAGRLHNKVNLMNELSKIRRVLQKLLPDAPHEVLLVLDASTGQNAIEQAKQFTAATDVSGMVLTKLDGTAKGGVVIGIASQFGIPVRFIGVGEGMGDLQIFDGEDFIDSLFQQS
jgi:fused signal recognition particle receptor